MQSRVRAESFVFPFSEATVQRRTNRTKMLLVIEVAESSLGYDLGEKAVLYAQAGVPEYWFLNPVDRGLEVFRDPDPGGGLPSAFPRGSR